MHCACVVQGGGSRPQRGGSGGGVIPEGISEDGKSSGVGRLAALWPDSIEGAGIAETLWRKWLVSLQLNPIVFPELLPRRDLMTRSKHTL